MAKGRAIKTAHKSKKKLDSKGKPVASVKTLGQVLHPVAKI